MLFKDTVLLNNLASYVPQRADSVYRSLYRCCCCFFGTVGAYMPLIERGVYLRRRDSIHHFHIHHNAPYLPPPPPPKFCIIVVSNFSWVLQSFEEKSKTMAMQNFAGKTRSIMVYVKVVNSVNCSWFFRVFFASVNFVFFRKVIDV